MSRLTQSIHLCFDLHRFLLPGGTVYRVFLPTYYWSRLLTWPNHLSLAFLHPSVMISTSSLSLMLSFLTWSLSVWPHAHLHIFNLPLDHKLTTYYMEMMRVTKMSILMLKFRIYGNQWRETMFWFNTASRRKIFIPSIGPGKPRPRRL